jgi:hypothetical protein
MISSATNASTRFASAASSAVIEKSIKRFLVP